MRSRTATALLAVLLALALTATAWADVLTIGGVPSKVRKGQTFTVTINGAPFVPPATLTVFLAAKRCAKDSATEKASGAQLRINRSYGKPFKLKLKIRARSLGRHYICGYFGDADVASSYRVVR